MAEGRQLDNFEDAIKIYFRKRQRRFHLFFNGCLIFSSSGDNLCGNKRKSYYIRFIKSRITYYSAASRSDDGYYISSISFYIPKQKFMEWLDTNIIKGGPSLSPLRGWGNLINGK